VIGLVQLARLRTGRQRFYTALATAFACVAPQLGFFWNIFGAAAIALWLVLALWLAAFVVLTHLAIVRLGLKRAALLTPFFWTGLEYFRSELYYLKFSWLNVGYAFAEWTILPWRILGVFGIGFMVAILASISLIECRKHFRRLSLAELVVIIFSVLLLASIYIPAMVRMRDRLNCIAAGVQLEFPSPDETVPALDKTLRGYQTCVQTNYFFQSRSNLDLVVLPEYTLAGEPTEALKDWCRINQKFLIVGGKQPLGETNFYNTAFVIGTNGEIVFKQVKSVPIQFFKDGLPAPEQKVWDSPWGKIGICICYDLSYTRVTDELVKQGAPMLLVPTMDVAEWGRHARIAPVRAAEYGIPIFRVASSGISQGVNRTGAVQSHAPFPGDDELIFFGARLTSGQSGSRPVDRWLAPLCSGVMAVFVLRTMIAALRRKFPKAQVSR
jgi:apolipoprotein N-acyltransferase